MIPYKKCKFYTKLGQCSHSGAPIPHHSECIGKESCGAWSDSIECRGIDNNMAPRLYTALKEIIEQAFADGPSEDALQRGAAALDEAEGK